MRLRALARWARTGAAAAVFAATGAGFLAFGLSRQEPAPPALPAGVTVQEIPGDRGAAGDESSRSGVAPTAVEGLPPSAPVQVRIPRLGVAAETTDLGLDSRQQLETPADPGEVGWYDASPAPGSKGPSVLAGHVTWDRKPAVFFRLGEVRAGDRVEVARTDGRTAVFAVERVGQYAKDAFPTAQVYGDLDYPGLRLITCGGGYDDAQHRYLDNLVVYARMVSVERV